MQFKKQIAQALALLWSLQLLTLPAPALPSALELRAFEAAGRAFDDGFYDRAEKELGEFIAGYPQSDLLAEAVLLQAQARFRLKNFESTLALLNGRLNQAGKLLDQYRFWLAEAQFQLGDFQSAAQSFSRMIADFPQSNRRLEAAYREALAHYKLGALPQAVGLLRSAEGVFQTNAQAQSDNEYAVRGALLLAEVLLQQKNFSDAEAVLAGPLASRPLTPNLSWQRQYWLTRTQMEAGRSQSARDNAAELERLAAATGSRHLEAETTVLQGAILQQLNDFDLAIQTFEKNLADDLSAERHRQALLKIIELSMAQNKPVETLKRFEAFLKKFPQDPSLDLVRLTIGELHLRQYYSLREETGQPLAERAVAGTNFLQQARAQFEQVLSDFPQSTILGKAHLNRGFIAWEEGRFADGALAFKEATLRLPPSEDQAVAHFKLADTQLHQKNYSQAISNYQFVIEHYESFPRIRSTLFDQALYQIVRGTTELGDVAGAEAAIRKILLWYPESLFSDRSMLLVGQALTRQDRPADARLMFVDFLKRFPNSSLAPEVHLAISRTYVQERDWPAAIGKFDDWVSKYVQHASRPRAEFDRAWVNALAGRQSNALSLFINFTNQFNAHPLAPLAQNWMADYFWRGGDYLNAEKNYQLLYQNTNWPRSELTYQARMMAGRAAIARQGYAEAEDYFKTLINDESCPDELVAQAWFALGDTIIMQPVADPTKALDRYAEAILAFSMIPQKFPNSPLAPLANGKIGNCHFQLASKYPGERYTNALSSYQKVLEAPQASVAARSQAEVGIGLVYEKLAQPKLARDHYLNVVYGINLRDRELIDPFWVKEAGLAATRLVESDEQWQSAVEVYKRLIDVVPALRPALEKRLEFARARLKATRVP